jgi:hypothetical protein
MDTPVPIPNTEVKHFCGDGTAFKSVGEQLGAGPYILKSRFKFKPAFFLGTKVTLN